MKKKYATPIIAVEKYELTQAIAACGTKIGFLSSDCVLKDPDATPQMKNLAYTGFFNEKHCEEYPFGMDKGDSICYHTNLKAAFNS